MRKRLLLSHAFLCICFASPAAVAQSPQVAVSPTLKIWEPLHSESVSLPTRAHKSWSVALGAGDGVRVVAQIEPNWVSPPTLAFCDSSGLAKFLENSKDSELRANCFSRSMSSATDGISITLPDAATVHAVVQNGKFAEAQTVRVTVERERAFSQSRFSQIPGEIGQIGRMLSENFVGFDLSWAVGACGHSNAYYDPGRKRITLCSEMLTEMARSGPISQSPVLNVLMHEVGHGLIDQWNLPGADNEEMADELGAMLIMIITQGVDEIGKAVRYWQTQAPWDAALIESAPLWSSPHPLAVQRGRKLSAIADNPGYYLARWYPIIVAHLSKKTLQSHADGAFRYADAALARSVLVARGGEEAGEKYAAGGKGEEDDGGASVVGTAFAGWLAGIEDPARRAEISSQPLLVAFIADYIAAIGAPTAFGRAVNHGTPICMTACREAGAPAIDVGNDVTAADFVRMIFSTRFGLDETAERRWRAIERIDAVIAGLDLATIDLPPADAEYFASEFASIVTRSESLSGRVYPNARRLIEEARRRN
jgi:hypothetical protein